MLYAHTAGLQKYQELVDSGRQEGISTWNEALQNQQSDKRPQKFTHYQDGTYNTGQEFDYDNPNSKYGISPKYHNMKEEIWDNE